MYQGYPQPWRGWLLALTVVIFGIIIVSFFTGGSWALFVVVLALIAIQFGLTRYVRKRM